VFNALLDNRHKPLTLARLSEITGIQNHGSIASRLRDLRADGFDIPRQPTGVRGVFTYTYRGIR
jgi:predicted transcriptional regulator